MIHTPAMICLKVMPPQCHGYNCNTQGLAEQITVYIGLRLSVTNRTLSLTNVKKKNIYKNFSKNVLTCSRVNIRNIAELMSSIVVIVLQ